MNYFTLGGVLLTSWVPVENAVERVGFPIKGVSDNQKIFLPEAEELPVYRTGETERYVVMTRGWNGSKQHIITQEVFSLSVCIHASGILKCLHICTCRWQYPGSGQTAVQSCPVRRWWSWCHIDLVCYHGICVHWQQLRRLYCQSETFPSLWRRMSRLTKRETIQRFYLSKVTYFFGYCLLEQRDRKAERETAKKVIHVKQMPKLYISTHFWIILHD